MNPKIIENIQVHISLWKNIKKFSVKFDDISKDYDIAGIMVLPLSNHTGKTETLVLRKGKLLLAGQMSFTFDVDGSIILDCLNGKNETFIVTDLLLYDTNDVETAVIINDINSNGIFPFNKKNNSSEVSNYGIEIKQLSNDDSRTMSVFNSLVEALEADVTTFTTSSSKDYITSDKVICLKDNNFYMLGKERPYHIELSYNNLNIRVDNNPAIEDKLKVNKTFRYSIYNNADLYLRFKSPLAAINFIHEFNDGRVSEEKESVTPEASVSDNRPSDKLIFTDELVNLICAKSRYYRCSSLFKVLKRVHHNQITLVLSSEGFFATIDDIRYVNAEHLLTIKNQQILGDPLHEIPSVDIDLSDKYKFYFIFNTDDDLYNFLSSVLDMCGKDDTNADKEESSDDIAWVFGTEGSLPPYHNHANIYALAQAREVIIDDMVYIRSASMLYLPAKSRTFKELPEVGGIVFMSIEDNTRVLISYGVSTVAISKRTRDGKLIDYMTHPNIRIKPKHLFNADEVLEVLSNNVRVAKKFITPSMDIIYTKLSNLFVNNRTVLRSNNRDDLISITDVPHVNHLILIQDDLVYKPNAVGMLECITTCNNNTLVEFSFDSSKPTIVVKVDSTIHNKILDEISKIMYGCPMGSRPPFDVGRPSSPAENPWTN